MPATVKTASSRQPRLYNTRVHTDIDTHTHTLMYTHTHNNNCKQVTDTSDPERARVAHNEASLLQRLSSAAGSSTLAPARGSTSSNCSSSSPDASDVRHTTCSHRSHQAQQSGQQQGRQATKQQNIAQQRHRQDRQQQQQQQQQQPRSNFVSRCQREHPAALSSCDLQQGSNHKVPLSPILTHTTGSTHRRSLNNHLGAHNHNHNPHTHTHAHNHTRARTTSCGCWITLSTRGVVGREGRLGVDG